VGRANDDDMFTKKIIITDDETRGGLYGYDVETKVQSSQLVGNCSPRPKKARQIRSNVEVSLTVFFDTLGVIHHEIPPEGQTVNSKRYYLKVV